MAASSGASSKLSTSASSGKVKWLSAFKGGVEVKAIPIPFAVSPLGKTWVSQGSRMFE